MTNTETAVAPAREGWRWRAPSLVIGLTAFAILLFVILATAADRVLASSAWFLLFRDERLELIAAMAVPAGIVFSCCVVLLAETADVGWERSALRRVLFLQTRSSRTDFFYFLLRVSGLMHVISFLLTFGVVFVLATRLGHWLELDLLAAADSLPLHLLAVILVNTFVFYWAHRLMHTSALFEIHKVHHSALELNVLTTLRNHPVDFIIMIVINSVPAAMLGANPLAVSVYFVLNSLYQCTVHSEMRCLEHRVVRALVVTPAAHKIHHSSSPRHYGRNYGILTLWEVLFGTYAAPLPDESLSLGIDDHESFNTDRPIVELTAVLTRWLAPVGRAVESRASVLRELRR